MNDEEEIKSHEHNWTLIVNLILTFLLIVLLGYFFKQVF